VRFIAIILRQNFDKKGPPKAAADTLWLRLGRQALKVKHLR
tara:strand:- start:956 stop:1078 length:123 start_codon:yes stop_codon:yes gene_type:complete